MNTEVEVKKAQEYIAKHGIKHIFAQLLTDSTLYRPKDPVAFFIERLKNYKEHGLGSDYEFPRIILMLCPNEGLQTVGEAIAMDYDFKLINPKLVEEMIFVRTVLPLQCHTNTNTLSQEIKEHRREHDSDTFLLINCPNKVKDIMEFEKQLHVSNITERNFFSSLSENRNLYYVYL